jgi:hypothetical protein
MQIDNYEAAQDLSDRLKETVPFQATVGKQLLKMMKDKGDRVSLETKFTITGVTYFGDIGGINCVLESMGGSSATSEQYVVSITHLKIDPEHPLAGEVEMYQRTRVQRLKLQDQTGYVAELLAQTTLPKRKPRKGFGQ